MNIIEELIKSGSEKLKRSGINSFLKDSRILMGYIIDNDIERINFYNVKSISTYKRKKYFNLIERRCSNEPISRIIRKKYFWKYLLYISKDVFDPRPETELLVSKVADFCDEKTKIIDVGTGSGCIAISLALELRNINITAIDISDSILKTAMKNAKKYGAKVKFKKSFWFENINEKFDVLVSNPPYISNKDLLSLDYDVLNYDPIAALTLFDNGLGAYKIFAKEMDLILKPGGFAFFEIGYNQKNKIIEIFNNYGYKNISTYKDFADKDRVLCVKKDA